MLKWRVEGNVNLLESNVQGAYMCNCERLGTDEQVSKFNEVLESDAYYNLAIIMMSVLILMIGISFAQSNVFQRI